MRSVVVLGLLSAVATPAIAQRAQPMLPEAPRGVDYAETVCVGGIDGRYEVTRVLATGQVLRVTRRTPVQRTLVSRAEVMKIMRDLDRARFERRTVQRVPRRIADGIDCSLARRKDGRLYSVALQQEMGSDAAVQDLLQVVAEVNALGRRATGPIIRPAVAAR
jgi:hypothetical protein